MGWAWFVEMHLLLGGIHLDFITLVIVIVIMLIVLTDAAAQVSCGLTSNRARITIVACEEE